jgi:hypothetical protein
MFVMSDTSTGWNDETVVRVLVRSDIAMVVGVDKSLEIGLKLFGRDLVLVGEGTSVVICLFIEEVDYCYGD